MTKLMALGGAALALFLMACGSPAPRGVATGAQGRACMAAVPAGVTTQLGAGDCVLSAVTLPDNSVVVGTSAGNIGVFSHGKLDKIPAGGDTGGVSDLRPLPPSARVGGVGGQFVTFAVDQGVGLFDEQTDSLISFGGRTFRYADGIPATDTSPWITPDGKYLKMLPDIGRPHLNTTAALNGTYVRAKDAGGQEYLGLSVGGGEMCATYLPSAEAVPERAWCASAPDLSAPPPPPSAIATPPPGGDPCLMPEPTVAGTSLSLRVTADALSPANLQVHLGQPYGLTVEVDDPTSQHALNIVDGGMIARDQNGVRMCMTSLSSGPRTYRLVLTGSPRLLTIEDPFHPSLQAQLSVVP